MGKHKKNILYRKKIRRRNTRYSISGCGSESLRAAYSVRAASATDSVTVDALTPTEKPRYKTSGPLQRRPRYEKHDYTGGAGDETESIP